MWIVVVVVLVVVAVWWFNKGGSEYGGLYPSTSPSASASPHSSGSYKSTATPNATAAMNYTQLVQQYGNNRIQFDQNCTANPSSMSLKNGASIMLDNRSNQSKVVTINGVKYNLGAYGYAIAKISSPTLPTNIGVSCDTRVNTSTINLQAMIGQ